MTVCSKPKSFKYGELERGASTSACSNSTSMDSLCTFTRQYSNTTTTEEDAEICSSASSTTLSLVSLSSEDDNWKQFGYLLDSSDPMLDFDSTVPYHQQFEETPSFLRSNSAPETTSPYSKCDLTSQQEISSLNVEVSSNTDLGSCASMTQCEENANAATKTESNEDEPVAKRTRRSLAMRNAMNDSLAKLSNVSKEEMISKFLHSSPKATATRIHNVCRPWWHKKILTKPEFSPEPGQKLEVLSASEEENENNLKAFRRPKEFSDVPFGSRSTNPESQNVSSNKQKVEETIKLEPASVKQETEDPKLNEDIAAQKNLRSLDMIKSEALSPSSHSADDERSPSTKASRNRKRPKPSPEKAKRSNSGRSNTPTSTRKQNRRQQKVTHSAKTDNEDGDPVLDPKKKHCLCDSPYDPKKFYLMCDRCRQWFHGKCVGITEKKAQKMDSWMCTECDKEKTEELYCICRQPYDEARFYVGCDSCEDWFHPECINSTKEEVSEFDQFLCPKCRR